MERDKVRVLTNVTVPIECFCITLTARIRLSVDIYFVLQRDFSPSGNPPPVPNRSLSQLKNYIICVDINYQTVLLVVFGDDLTTPNMIDSY